MIDLTKLTVTELKYLYQHGDQQLRNLVTEALTRRQGLL